MWDNSSKVIFSSLLCIWVPLHIFLLIHFWRRRNVPYIKYRYPLLMTIASIHSLLTAIVILIQEIVISSGYTFPGYIFLLINASYPQIQFAFNTIRVLWIISLFNPELRANNSIYFKVLQPAFMKKFFIITTICSILLFIILISCFEDYQSSYSGRSIVFLREWYIPLACWIILAPSGRKFATKTLQIDDIYNVAVGLRHGQATIAIQSLIYIIVTAVFSFRNDRSVYESSYLPFHYWHVFFSMYITLRFVGMPVYRTWHQLTNQVQSISEIRNATGKLGILSIELSTPTASHFNKKSTHISEISSNTNSKIVIDHNERPITKSKNQDMKYILRIPELLQLFEDHARRAFCWEMIAFWKKAKHILTTYKHGFAHTHSGINIFAAKQEKKAHIKAMMNNNDAITEEVWLQECKNIYEEYIKEGSALQINISAALRGKWDKLFNNPSPTSKSSAFAAIEDIKPTNETAPFNHSNDNVNANEDKKIIVTFSRTSNSSGNIYLMNNVEGVSLHEQENKLTVNKQTRFADKPSGITTDTIHSNQTSNPNSNVTSPTNANNKLHALLKEALKEIELLLASNLYFTFINSKQFVAYEENLKAIKVVAPNASINNDKADVINKKLEHELQIVINASSNNSSNHPRRHSISQPDNNINNDKAIRSKSNAIHPSAHTIQNEAKAQNNNNAPNNNESKNVNSMRVSSMSGGSNHSNVSYNNYVNDDNSKAKSIRPSSRVNNQHTATIQ